jgi:hypothetical protein
VELVGPGAVSWAQQELGWILNTTSLGPDLIHALIAVEEVGTGAPALNQLVDGDADPSGQQLPLRRVFREGRQTDPETGRDLDLDHLAEGLHTISMLRLLARFNRPRISDEVG